MLGLYRDNGTENGNYYLGFRVGLGELAVICPGTYFGAPCS